MVSTITIITIVILVSALLLFRPIAYELKKIYSIVDGLYFKVYTVQPTDEGWFANARTLLSRGTWHLSVDGEWSSKDGEPCPYSEKLNRALKVLNTRYPNEYPLPKMLQSNHSQLTSRLIDKINERYNDTFINNIDESLNDEFVVCSICSKRSHSRYKYCLGCGCNIVEMKKFADKDMLI